MDTLDFDFDLTGRDHAFENIYVPAINAEASGNPRYGMLVRASAVPTEFRERSHVKHFSTRPGLNPQPYPVLGTDPVILVAGGKKPRVDWRSAGAMRYLAELVAEARLRNETDDWAFRGLDLNLQGVAFEIGQLPRYKDDPSRIPAGFRRDTLIYTVHKVTLI